MSAGRDRGGPAMASATAGALQSMSSSLRPAGVGSNNKLLVGVVVGVLLAALGAIVLLMQ
jgi:hypothetical protein